MFRIGISSSAFLLSRPEEVVALARDLGFDGIEWAGDPHLPEGDLEAARSAMMATLRAGMTISSYAPLYRVLPGGGPGIDFSAILATALAINAPMIRVYAGNAAKLAGADRAAMLGELRRLGDAAGDKGIALALSPGTRTCMENFPAALALADEASHPYVRLAWEPLPESRPGEGVEILADDPSIFIILRARRIDADGRGQALRGEADRWTRVISTFVSKPGPASIGCFVLLGGIGGIDASNREGIDTLIDDLAFAREAARR
jgi:hypothetical protein